ncbi:Hypothetical protein CINCED_3A011844 [Cinara cedri]|uniref:Uncharacterized protein n=1 Tax=Cinara cedri TaxID=506608 RepID=A0A5E4NKK5_9HEMI|nr:Hypothetical protein CINCED_3A011844 [Cinara cedri]
MSNIKLHLSAQQHIAQIDRYFKSDITSINSEVALKTLFGDGKGIVKYAKIVISLDSNTRELCTLYIITTKKSADISIKTYQIYEKLFELNDFSDQIEIVKIIEHLNNEVSLGEKITATDIPITVKSTLEKSLMCSFMCHSVLKIITKLDLFTNESPNEIEIEYVAKKPSDFTALVNLVTIVKY